MGSLMHLCMTGVFLRTEQERNDETKEQEELVRSFTVRLEDLNNDDTEKTFEVTKEPSLALKGIMGYIGYYDLWCAAKWSHSRPPQLRSSATEKIWEQLLD